MSESLQDGDKGVFEYNREISKVHISLIEKRQDTRFELLKNSVIGIFVYFAFCFGSENRIFVCRHSAIFLVLVPCAFMIFCAIYISTIQSSITKHGGYVAYMYRNGLLGKGLETNNFAEYLKSFRYTGFENVYYRFLGNSVARHLHFSQAFLLVLCALCFMFYLFIERTKTLEQACQFATERAETSIAIESPTTLK